MVGGGLGKMVPAKRVARKAKRAAKPIIESEPVETVVPVQTSPEPIKLHSAEDSLRLLLDEAPAVPEVSTPQALNTWIDDYSRWKRKVAGSKR
jgi:hypothetical protein